MQRKYPNLCKPITIGNVTFRNRMFGCIIWRAPFPFSIWSLDEVDDALSFTPG